MASLGAASAEVILNLFRRLNKDLGQMIVMVTHEPEDEKYVDRVIWLKAGRETVSRKSNYYSTRFSRSNLKTEVNMAILHRRHKCSSLLFQALLN